MKKFIIVMFVFIFANKTYAQLQIDGGVGLAISKTQNQYFIKTYNFTGIPSYTEFSTYKVTSGGYGLYLYPKYHFAEIGRNSLSLGIPIHIGLIASDEMVPWIYDVNIALDINGGRLNLKNYDQDKFFGYFAGVGLGMLNNDFYTSSYLISTEKDKDQIPKNTIIVPEDKRDDKYIVRKCLGPLFHMGVTFPYLFNRDKNSNMGLKVFYKPGLGKNNLSYFGISLFIATSFGND